MTFPRSWFNVHQVPVYYNDETNNLAEVHHQPDKKNKGLEDFKKKNENLSKSDQMKAQKKRVWELTKKWTARSTTHVMSQMGQHSPGNHTVQGLLWHECGNSVGSLHLLITWLPAGCMDSHSHLKGYKTDETASVKMSKNVFQKQPKTF